MVGSVQDLGPGQLGLSGRSPVFSVTANENCKIAFSRGGENEERWREEKGNKVEG